MLLAATAVATATTPAWALGLVAVLGPILGFGAHWVTKYFGHQDKKVELSENAEARIEETVREKTKDANDYALAQLEALSRRIDQQDKKILHLEDRNSKLGNYVEDLRVHISEGKPPPPPGYPSFNGSHTSEIPQVS